MNQRTEPNAEVITIVAEPDALTFATRKEWQKLPEICLGELTRHETALVFKGTDSIFFLLKDMDPSNWSNNTVDHYRLVRVSIDEDDKQVLHIMTLSKAEAEQLMRNQLTIWE